MRDAGSVNHTDPYRGTTTSFGELSGLPAHTSASTVMEPSYSVRVTRRVPCSHVTSRPPLSRVFPLAKLDGWRQTLVAPVCSSHRISRLLGMSLHRRQRAS